jgi:hypothetical protein
MTKLLYPRADAYMNFILARLKDRVRSIDVMGFTIPNANAFCLTLELGRFSANVSNTRHSPRTSPLTYTALISRVYTIHGGKDLPEEELSHLAGHKDSRPVRIGNGAVDHLQLVCFWISIALVLSC